MRDTRQRLDGSEDAVAYRVASLLQPTRSSHSLDAATSLRGLTARIEEFLTVAPQVPAVQMEPLLSEADGVDMEAGGEDVTPADIFPSVQLNVVAGVLEETRSKADRAPMASIDGLLLPNAQNESELHRFKVEQAQAMLNLMSALSPSSPSSDLSTLNTHKNGFPSIPPFASAYTERRASIADDDDEDGASVAVMEAEDLMNEDTSDEDDAPVQQQLVQELD